jgi:hypothetical protein
MFLVSFVMAQNKFEGRIGFAGGYLPGWNYYNFDKLNSFIELTGALKFSNHGFFYHGGGGYIYIMIVPNLRIGGIGLGGNQTLTSRTIIGNIKEIKFNQSFGGLSLEYTSSISSVNISYGAIIGVGETKIYLKSLFGNANWNDIWKYFEDTMTTNHSYSNSISANYLTLVPILNLEYSLSRFTAIRLGCGYAINFNSSWYLNENEKVQNVPSNILENNFFLSGGILIGFFSN